MTAKELILVLQELPEDTPMFFECDRPIPITTVTLTKLYLYNGRDENNNPVYIFLDGVVVWNE